VKYRPGLFVALLWLPLAAAAAQSAAPEPGRLVLPDFSGLASKAVQSVNISLDASTLGLAAGVLNADHNPDDAAVKALISGIDGVYVRSFTFDQDGAYSRADVDALTEQLQAPGWTPLVSTHDRAHHNDVDIYVRRRGRQTYGMAIIAAQPRQLTVVNVVGSIDLAKLAQLQGRFGVPKLGVSPRVSVPAPDSADTGPGTGARAPAPSADH
jgi:hypothetical protein